MNFSIPWKSEIGTENRVGESVWRKERVKDQGTEVKNSSVLCIYVVSGREKGAVLSVEESQAATHQELE